ncbi:MAG: LPS-assembly protein LptD [Bacteroidetes bacterium]|nr:LPS-assembly protein LptD [Bacteroidota bacterium]
MYIKFRYFVFLFVLIISIPIKNFAQVNRGGQSLESDGNNNSAITDSIAISDSIATQNQKKTNFIQTQVIYNAQDSIILSSDAKKVYLFNKAKIVYGDIELEADYIEYDEENNFVFARGVEDSLGNISGKPKFKENNEEFVARTIKYNFKTKKGYIQEVFTEEEQGFLHSEETKKLEDNSFLLKNGKYTTCENEEHPHFYLKMSKAKVIPNDKIISGPAFLVMEDIPIKFLGVPFGFFPNQSQYSSGIIIPSYGEETKRGFYLQDGGYYFGISNKMDLAITGDIFSKGSWGSDMQFRYKKRYKFNSNFHFTYAEFIQSEKGLEDYSKTKNMAIRWTHTQDPKANPNTTFKASVNYSTSEYDKFNSKSIEQLNTNTKQSSISYGKNWAGSPFRFNMDLKHSQNSKNNSINLTLPVMTFNMDRQYPFRKKNSTGETKWYEDIEIQYSSKAENKISTVDSLLFKETEWTDFDNGFQHNIPLSTNFKILQYFNLSPRVEYTGILYPNYLEYSYVENVDTVSGVTSYELVEDTVPTVRYAQMVTPSISLSVSPNIYGMYQMRNPDSKIVAIRHVLTPSVSISYRPDMGSMIDGYYFSDTISGRDYSIFDNGIYRLPSAPGESGTVNFGLNNNLEMKVRDFEDTTGTGTKKIKLLESFRLSTSYDLFADSLHWSPISFNARTSMFENKLSFQVNGRLDPYALNQTTGRVYDEFMWNTNQGGFVRLTSFDFSIDVKLNSPKDGTENRGQNQPAMTQLDDRFSRTGDELNTIQDHIVTYVDFEIPWNLSANFKYNYSKSGLEATKRITQTMSITGDVSLTKKWKISLRTNYDLVANELSSTSINIHRDLHCWEASFNWIPVGRMQSYNFTINVKGSTLKDFLKYNKRKSWQDNL